jgi:recombination protein RecR
MFPHSFQKLINRFSALPGIGPKMAERLVLHLYKNSKDLVDDFAADMINIKNVTTCTQCFNIAEDSLCTICQNSTRDTTKLCIVEESLDIIPIERSRAFEGLYHVLGGTLKKQESHHLTIDALLKRVAKDHFSEIIIATNFTTEGDFTAMHVQKLLLQNTKGVTISRLARGLATGSDIEYADDMTIRSALTNRQNFL